MGVFRAMTFPDINQILPELMMLKYIKNLIVCHVLTEFII